jgi:hypothetical protein
MFLKLGRYMNPGWIAAPAESAAASMPASTVLDIDATQAGSYPGTGTSLLNLEATPADGSAQSAYDFQLGDGSTSSTYPTFTGSAGSPSAYFAMDGGDYFRGASTFTQFLKDLHKNSDGASWWAAIAFRTPSSFTTNSHSGLFGQIGNGSLIGIRFSIIQNINAIRFNRYHTTNGQNTDISVLPTTSADHVIILSYEKGTRAVKAWINSPTATFSGTSGAITGNSDADTSTDRMETGAGGNGGSNKMISGFRWYAFSMGNAFLDDAGAAMIFAEYEGRHERDYTP